MTQDNIDNLLDQTLDDLADAPSIEPFPNGAHKCSISFKIDNKKASVMVTLKYIEPMELSDPSAVAPAPEDKNFIYLGLKKKDGSANEYAQGALKIIAKSLSTTFPGNSTRDILEAAENSEVIVVTKIRVGKGEYEGKDNIQIEKIDVV